MLKRKNIVGKTINFRRMVYAPVEENGVIFLFSTLTKDLNLKIETIRKGFPDCIARRYVGDGLWEQINIEFEVRSSEFVRHGHLDSMKSGVKCDMIVCWEHDWAECPKEIEVLELKTEIQKYPNEEVEETEEIVKKGNYTFEEHVNKIEVESVREIYINLHKQILNIDESIKEKIFKTGISFKRKSYWICWLGWSRNFLILNVPSEKKALEARNLKKHGFFLFSSSNTDWLKIKVHENCNEKLLINLIKKAYKMTF